MAFGITKNLNMSKIEKKEHIIVFMSFQNTAQKELFCFLYDNLNVLDSKTSALLQFNSVIIAIVTIAIALSEINWIKILMGIVFIFIGTATCISLRSISLHWASTNDLKKIDDYLEKLLEIRDNRTIAYRLSRLLSITSVILFGTTILLDILIEVF